jgi:hypothetical protein
MWRLMADGREAEDVQSLEKYPLFGHLSEDCTWALTHKLSESPDMEQKKGRRQKSAARIVMRKRG